MADASIGNASFFLLLCFLHTESFLWYEREKSVWKWKPLIAAGLNPQSIQLTKRFLSVTISKGWTWDKSSSPKISGFPNISPQSCPHWNGYRWRWSQTFGADISLGLLWIQLATACGDYTARGVVNQWSSGIKWNSSTTGRCCVVMWWMTSNSEGQHHRC